jgi:hypothetical protein
MNVRSLLKAVADGLGSGVRVMDTLRASGATHMTQMRAIAVIRTVAPSFESWDADMVTTRGAIEGVVELLLDD